MTNKQTLDTGLTRLAHTVINKAVNATLTEQVQAKHKTSGGLAVLYFQIPAQVRAMLPWPGSKEPKGNRPADIVDTPRFNKDGEEVNTKQSTFKTIFDASEIGEKLAEESGGLPAKGGDDTEVSNRDSIKEQRAYGVRLLSNVAMLDIVLSEIKKLDGVDYRWITSGKKDPKTGKQLVIRNRIPIKLISTEEAGENDGEEKVSVPDKPMKLSEVLRLKPWEAEKQKGDNMLAKLLATGKKKNAKAKKKGGADANAPTIKSAAQFADVGVTLANFVQDKDALNKVFALKDEQSLANIAALADTIADIQANEKFWQKCEAAQEKMNAAAGVETEDENAEQAAA